MSTKTQNSFVQQFYKFVKPIPDRTSFTHQEVKTNDMKIILEIVTCSYLRMQTDIKTKEISFSCKNYGKSCFEITGYQQEGLYYIKDDFTKMSHFRNCQLKNEGAEYLKVYNLMKLNKNLIEEHMKQNNLCNSSPAQILTSISKNGDFYFFQEGINHNSELRRKLRKRFDNIINIDIKKITKQGRKTKQDSCYYSSQSQEKGTNNQTGNIKKTKKAINQFLKNKNCKKIKNNIKNKSKIIKKNDKKSFPIKRPLHSLKKPQQHRNNTQGYIQTSQSIQRQIPREQAKFDPNHQQAELPKSNIDIGIYFNSNSESQLKQIKQLKQDFNHEEDILNWSSSSQEEGVRFETINDKIRQDIFLSLRNSILKRSLQTNSLQFFGEMGANEQNQLEQNVFEKQNNSS